MGKKKDLVYWEDGEEVSPGSDESVLLAHGVCEKTAGGRVKASFVGAIFSDKTVRFVLPKLFSKSSGESGKSENSRVAWTILRVLNIYASRLKSGKASGHKGEHYIGFYSGENPTAEMLAAASHLLEDYERWGIYSRNKRNSRLGELGAVDWGKTVGKVIPLFSRGTPIYDRRFIRSKEKDFSYSITRLHRHALDEIISIGIAEIFGRHSLNIDREKVEKLSESPPKDHVLKAIEREGHRVFDDRSIQLLRALSKWFGCQRKWAKNETTLFGTFAFHEVWEDVCRVYFDDRTNVSDGRWKLPPPSWKFEKKEQPTFGSPLVPDIVRIDDGGGRLYLIDAKYYKTFVARDENNLPGATDVAKQYSYEAILKSEVESRKCGFNPEKIKNMFVFPSLGKSLEKFGVVEQKGMRGSPIDLVALPYFLAFDAYLKKEPMDGVLWEELSKDRNIR